MPNPSFAPLITGFEQPAPQGLARAAIDGATCKRFGAGDLLWAADPHQIALSLVLEPQVEAKRCAEMLALGAVAFGDASGALIPAELAITYSWPGQLRLNGAALGQVQLSMAESPAHTPPDWLILSLNARLRPPPDGPEPGHMATQTSFWDEGCGSIAPCALLESLTKHLVNWLHRWEDQGFDPISRHWWARLDPAQPLAQPGQSRLQGLGPHGQARLCDGRVLSPPLQIIEQVPQ